MVIICILVFSLIVAIAGGDSGGGMFGFPESYPLGCGLFVIALLAALILGAMQLAGAANRGAVRHP